MPIFTQTQTHKNTHTHTALHHSGKCLAASECRVLLAQGQCCKPLFQHPCKCHAGAHKHTLPVLSEVDNSHCLRRACQSHRPFAAPHSFRECITASRFPHPCTETVPMMACTAPPHRPVVRSSSLRGGRSLLEQGLPVAQGLGGQVAVLLGGALLALARLGQPPPGV